ncbi:MAG: hypothetical protein ACR2LK_12455 [Solirubrobacteraceae bacterium]
MVVFAAALIAGCALLALRIWQRQQGREHTAEFDEALERLREQIPRERVLAIGAGIVLVLTLAVTARNPSRWPVLLGVLVALGVGFFLVRRHRGEDSAS